MKLKQFKWECFSMFSIDLKFSFLTTKWVITLLPAFQLQSLVAFVLYSSLPCVLIFFFLESLFAKSSTGLWGDNKFRSACSTCHVKQVLLPSIFIDKDWHRLTLSLKEAKSCTSGNLYGPSSLCFKLYNLLLLMHMSWWSHRNAALWSVIAYLPSPKFST